MNNLGNMVEGGVKEIEGGIIKLQEVVEGEEGGDRSKSK